MGIRRVAATGAVVLGGLAVLSGCGLDIMKNKATDEADITERFTSVRFANDSGNVTITTGGTPSLAREIHFEDDKPAATHRVENGVLILDPCPVDDCWIDYEVVVPDGTKVDGSVESGDTEITGAGQVNVRASSGNVTVTDTAGAVNVEVSSGNADLRGIGGAAQVRAESGNVTVGMEVPEDVRIQAASGNVEVSVPDGAYRVEASAASGDVDNQIGSDAAAGHHLDLHTESGNVTVTRA
jgi:Putative adhesin